MPIWVTLYVAVLLISLPMGLVMLRKMEGDWLHPVGALISTLLSAGFVVSYWSPELLPFEGPTVWLFLCFVLFWDFYSLQRAKEKLPKLLEMEGDPSIAPNSMTWWVGMLMMVPAYFFGLMVCLRAM